MTQEQWIYIFSNNLKSLMHEHHIDQKELARRSGLSKSSISKYVNGHALPTVPALACIADSLVCDLEDILYFGDRVDLYPQRYDPHR